jgi:hypothetical protein
MREEKPQSMANPWQRRDWEREILECAPDLRGFPEIHR